MSSGRSRGWCYTLNNYNDDDLAKLGEMVSEYHVYGRERGDSGTPHLQGYVHFRNAKSFSRVKRLLGGSAHLEQRQGTAGQAIAYCKKDGDYTETGVAPQQGLRTDLASVRMAVMSGASMRTLIQEVTSYQGIRSAEKLLEYLEQPRDVSVAPEIHWFYGLTGTGKSKAAFERWPNAYWVPDGKWFVGYNGHEEVIWDDFRPGHVTFSRLLRLTDRYPVSVECKGGMRQFRAKTICFTSPEHPSEMFVDADDKVDQLMRRITKITHFTKMI